MSKTNGLPTGIYRRGNVLWAKVYEYDATQRKAVCVPRSTEIKIDGAPTREQLKQAERFRRAMLAKADRRDLIKEKTVEDTTIDELLEDTLRRLRVKHSDGAKVNTYTWSLYRAAKIREHGLGALRAADLTTDHLEGFIDALLDEEYSKGSINHFLAMLSVAFHEGHRRTPPKVRSVPHFPKFGQDELNVRSGYLTWEEYQQLHGALDPSIRPLEVMLYHLGLRLGEALSLEWSKHIVFNRAGSPIPGMIRLNPLETKNREARTCPMWGDIYACLLEQRRLYDAMGLTHGKVFFWHTRPPNSVAAGSPLVRFRAFWRKAASAIGKPDLIPHDMRRSAVSNMIEHMGMSAKQAMLISGHKTMSMIERYHMIPKGEMRETFDKLQGFYVEQQAADAETRVQSQVQQPA